MPFPEDEAMAPALDHETVADSQPFGPSPSSNAPGLAQEPHGESDQDAEGEEPLPEFDPRWRDEFSGLLYLGALTRSFPLFGHEFEIRTLSTAELLDVALVVKKYSDTMGAQRAFNAAVCAGALVHIDGQPLPVPVTTRDSDTPFQNRFNWVTRNIFPPVMDALYTEYLILNQTVQKVFAALGEASG